MPPANTPGESRVREVFLEALEKPTPQERKAYLDGACRGDPALRAKVEALLKSHCDDSFLQRSAAELATTDVPANELSERPGDRIGRYRLREKIGEGGCGVVYVAEQEEPVRRRVALKVIKLGMDTRSVIARFEVERQALAMMDHPNIAKVFDAGATETGRPFFVMELVRGIKITEYCDQNKLTTAQRLGLFIQVCNAIQHAHQKGIIHRDIKPSNVLVTLHDGVPVPKVIDFGIAKATTNQRLTDKTVFTAFAQLLGTPDYMSPEQAEMSGLDVDTRSDIYALGVLLYDLLTGKTPFDTKELLQAGLDEMRRIIREKEPARPSTRLSTMLAVDLAAVALHRHADPPKLIHSLRGDLDWIVMKTLEKDRTRRYETANGLAMDIQRHLNNEPVVACPPSNLYRFQKLIRRNKLVFAAASTVAAALVIGLGISTWQFVEKNKAYHRAVAAEREQSRLRAEAQLAQANEARQRQQAEETGTRLAETLSQMEVQRAEELFTAGDSSSALAALAHVLRQNPTNSMAAERLISALTQRTFALPHIEPLRVEDFYILNAQFSPDGERLFTVSTNTVRLWDTHTGQPLTEPLRHEASIASAQFSPDGQRFVTASTNVVRLWDGRTGHPLIEPLKHRELVLRAEFSPDGRWVLAAARDKTIRIWDARTGQPMTDSLRNDKLRELVSLGADGQRLATDATNIAGYQPALSPDGQRVVTAFDDAARVWDLRTGQPLTPPLKHNFRVWQPQFSPDGRRVLTASWDRTARIWDAHTGQPLTEPLRHNQGVHFARYSPDGRYVATACNNDQTVQVWDVPTVPTLAIPLKHNGSVFSAHFSPDGQRVITASQDKTSRVWDAHTGQPLIEPLKHDNAVLSAQFSPDGQRVVTVSADKQARVWNAHTGQPLTAPLPHVVRAIDASASFSPSSQEILTVSSNIVQFWDARTGQVRPQTLKQEAPVRFARFSPNGQQLATVAAETVRFWDLRTRQLLAVRIPQALVSILDFSPDGQRVLTVSNQTAQIWDVRSGQPLTQSFTHAHWIGSAQFSPDGQRVVTASRDNTARIWDGRTGQPLTPPLNHNEAVLSAKFSPDGQRVVTASRDKTARVWDARTGQPLSEPLRHDGIVESAEFSPDGKWIVTGSDDKTARIWEVPGGPVPVPRWLPELAEAVAGQRIADRRTIEPVSIKELLQLSQHLGQSPEADHYARWAGWFFAEPESRTISPFSPITVAEYVQRLIQENTLGSLSEAVSLSPHHALALARLARQILALDPTENPRQMGEADFYSRRALRFSPDNQEIVQIRTEIVKRIGTEPEMVKALAWHRREAELCEQNNEWFAAVVHLDDLIDFQPNDQSLRHRRALAQAKLAAEKTTDNKGHP